MLLWHAYTHVHAHTNPAGDIIIYSVYLMRISLRLLRIQTKESAFLYLKFILLLHVSLKAGNNSSRKIFHLRLKSFCISFVIQRILSIKFDCNKLIIRDAILLIILDV